MGYRCHIEQARMPRPSVCETIQEEASVLSSLFPLPKHLTTQSVAKQSATPLLNSSAYIVRLCGAVRVRYLLYLWTLLTVRRTFPIAELGPTVMPAMLQHSQQDYGPLPSELGPHPHCGQSCRERRRTSFNVLPSRLGGRPHCKSKSSGIRRATSSLSSARSSAT